MLKSVRWWPLAAIVAVSLLMGQGRCIKEKHRTLKLIVEQPANLSNLAVVAAAKHYLLGIDTTTFQVRARIRCERTLFAKPVRLPDGGVLVVDDLYIRRRHVHMLNPDCSLRRSILVDQWYPTPFVHGNLLFLVGSDGSYGQYGKRVHVYGLDNFTQRKAFNTKATILRNEFFSAQGDKIFFPYVRSIDHLQGPVGAFPVMLDANTLDTTHLPLDLPPREAMEGEFVSVASGDSLIMIPYHRCEPIIYNVAMRQVLAQRNLTDDIKARVGNLSGIISEPRVHNGMLTMLCAQGPMLRSVYWIQIRLSDLSLVDIKRVMYGEAEPPAGEDLHTFGHLYVIEADRPGAQTFTATFVDWRTGEVVGECTVRGLTYIKTE